MDELNQYGFTHSTLHRQIMKKCAVVETETRQAKEFFLVQQVSSGNLSGKTNTPPPHFTCSRKRDWGGMGETRGRTCDNTYVKADRIYTFFTTVVSCWCQHSCPWVCRAPERRPKDTSHHYVFHEVKWIWGIIDLHGSGRLQVKEFGCLIPAWHKILNFSEHRALRYISKLHKDHHCFWTQGWHDATMAGRHQPLQAPGEKDGQ